MVRGTPYPLPPSSRDSFMPVSADPSVPPTASPSEEPISPSGTHSAAGGQPAGAQDGERPRSQSAEVTTLAGGLAHEIRNPLSTIRMNLDLLFEDAVESEDPKTRRMLRKLETIRRECARVEGLLSAFLQFARAGEMQKLPRDLSQVVQEFVDFYTPEARKYGIELRPHLASNLPLVDMDPTLVRQAVTNLTRNAQQAMPQGGVIELQTCRRGDQVCLDVIDTGVGIPRAVQEKLFQVFFSTKDSGTGLGLPTVRKIVEAHGGTIHCDSEPGRGTRFTLSFPCVHELPSPPGGNDDAAAERSA